ncbi:hypothetical protein, partial [Falsigemmobacter intermedius]|uniref:hypothetical protein n=1 Tax=Falsigemmobacter intermedius TaxID=1553448 RepID=UPI003EFF3939
GLRHGAGFSLPDLAQVGLCKFWIKFPPKCWRKIPHFAVLAISCSWDGHLRISGVGRGAWAAAAV